MSQISLPNLPFLRDEPLARHTSYRIGGPAKYLALPESIEHLENLAEYLRKSGEGYAILGNGSNLLAPDEGFDGWIIKTSALPSFIQFLPGDILSVSAGTMNVRALRSAANEGLSGLEYLSGVPGTIGGAVIMNAGTASGWVDKNILEVEAFSLSKGLKIYSKSELKYSYREQHFLPEDAIVLSAKFQMQRAAPEEIQRTLVAGLQKRKAAQPIEMPSCGSVFRNPPGTSAWKVIEEAGLRGKKQGGAAISPKHANFIVNEGGATMQDVLTLIELAKAEVKKHSGILLQEEVIVLRPKFLK